MKKTITVTYWGGEGLEQLYMDVNSAILADYLSTEKTYLTGIFDGKIVAVKTEQIISIEED